MDWEGCTQDVTLSNGDVIQDVATLQCIPIVFQNLVTAALTFAGSVAVIFIVYAGIKMLTSGGDPKQVEAAKNTLTYAIIGLIIILSSFFIVNIIAVLTGTEECLMTFFSYEVACK